MHRMKSYTMKPEKSILLACKKVGPKRKLTGREADNQPILLNTLTKLIQCARNNIVANQFTKTPMSIMALFVLFENLE